jgi:hypothetical protein
VRVEVDHARGALCPNRRARPVTRL